ncbi:hypothetical protein [Nocardia caishijiensis]|uniref:hypothetical protein n=1 Tax=Nocardia caishijiensis TaxID=184756 RepID=UPI0012ED0A8A|nr:hypothetical protein [Nocardia caishijiensis]
MTEEGFAKQFEKLYAYMDRRFDSLEKESKQDIGSLRDEVRTGFDQIAARLDDDEVERAAITTQLDRHERWHHEVADHLGLKLQHDA